MLHQGCYNMYQRYNSFYKIMLDVLKTNNSAINEDKLFILHRSHLMAVLLVKKLVNNILKDVSILTLIKKKLKKIRVIFYILLKKNFQIFIIATHGKTL